MKPLLIAHRGDTINHPENTAAAFESAFALQADGIELDVQLENDQLIVVHDYLHDTTQQYPLLSDILNKFKDKGRIEIELKSFNQEIVKKLATVLEQTNPKDYEITSSVLPLLQYVRETIPTAKIGMIFNSKLLEPWMTEEFIIEMLLGYMKLTGANVLHLDQSIYTQKLVEVFHDQGYVLHTHLTPATKANYLAIQELGIDQCTFDDINVLKEIR
ncbi:MAG: glycerophosphodiester phosphodiesterase [Weeksellaceae bacterium]